MKTRINKVIFTLSIQFIMMYAMEAVTHIAYNGSIFDSFFVGFIFWITTLSVSYYIAEIIFNKSK